MGMVYIERLRARLAPLRAALSCHPVYGQIDGSAALRLFMEHDVFAVWDFMSLLKALQRRLCSNEVPWLDEHGLMRRREASINDIDINEADRKFLWPAPGPRPADHAGIPNVE